MTEPTFSVIIPTYNRYLTLRERALASVFRQSRQDFEILVVGDGTDLTTETYMRYVAEHDDRVRFWNLPHYPYPGTREQHWGLIGLPPLNFALDRARGTWIATLADDDEWTDDHLEVLLKAAERTGADHVYGIAETFKDGVNIRQRYGAWPPGDGQFCNGANIYRRSLEYRYDMRCLEDRNRTGDADLWIRMYEDGVKFHFEPKVVLRYHRNWP